MTEQGNRPAQATIHKIFCVVDRQWRGIGTIPSSGLALRDDEYAEFDAEKKFNLGDISVSEPKDCISGLILQGLKKPVDCSHFGASCTPERPMGATMVSSEGACAAYFKYKR